MRFIDTLLEAGMSINAYAAIFIYFNYLNLVIVGASWIPD